VDDVVAVLQRPAQELPAAQHRHGWNFCRCHPDGTAYGAPQAAWLAASGRALAIFSGLADFSRAEDSWQLFTLNGFPGQMQPIEADHWPDEQDVGKTDRKAFVLSPVLADLQGMPPSLLATSTRDILLSGTTILHRALVGAGNDSQLVVFEALPHAFRYQFQLPETKEALELMAKFFDDKVQQ
jgi:epsilon-lactone hydrolase